MGVVSKNFKLLILHGWTTSTEKWNPFLDALKENGFNIELLKIPGLTEKTDKSWTLENYVEWLKERVGNEKVILIGHSNGGRIALAFSNKYPEKIRNLILIDSAGIYHKELYIRLKRLFFTSAAKLGKKLTSSEILRKFMYQLAGESDYKNADSLQRQTMINLTSSDLTPLLKNISVPALIIWGENDEITPISDGRLMQSQIKNSKMKTIKGAKHSPQFTHPKEVIKIINEYL